MSIKNEFKDTDKDRFFYGWIILAGCFFATMSYGLFYTFGVFFKSLQVEFGWSRALTSSVTSLHLIVNALSGIMIGRITDRYGPRMALTIGAFLIGTGLMLCSQIENIWHLYIFYGLIASLGAGVVYSLPTATVQRWFIEKRGLVLGITMSGVGFGTMIFSPIANYLISSYGWRVAYIVFGSVSLFVLTSFALTMVYGPEKIGLRPYGFHKNKKEHPLQTANPTNNKANLISGEETQTWTTREVIQTRAFWLVYLLHLFSVLPLFMIMVHIVPFATDIGIPKEIAASALGFIGGVSILGRIAMGSLSDRIGWKYSLIICVGLCGIMTFSLIYVRSVWALFVFVVLFGFFYGGKVSVFPGLVGSFFGNNSLAEIIGVLSTCLGISGMIGPIAGGYIYDRMGSYTLAFLLAFASYFIAFLFSIIVTPPQKCYKHNCEDHISAIK
ncbi:MAG: MFS transporter [Thermodesulfobacteriota bacterium]|nr:MFS transporter [Thermodesulfobacteriota bacterium]